MDASVTSVTVILTEPLERWKLKVSIVVMNHGFLLVGPNMKTEFENRVRRLQDMGVEDKTARSVLSAHDWDLEQATESIFS